MCHDLHDKLLLLQLLLQMHRVLIQEAVLQLDQMTVEAFKVDALPLYFDE